MAANDISPYTSRNSPSQVASALETYEKQHGVVKPNSIIRLSRKTFKELKASILVQKLAGGQSCIYETIHAEKKRSSRKGHPALLGQGTFKRVKEILGSDKGRYALATQMETSGPVSQGAIRAATEFSQHPHIEAGEFVQWTSVASGKTKSAFLMPFYKGSPQAHRRMSIEDFAGQAIQMARGLAAIHGKGSAHLDVKPGNFLRNGPIVKVCDFDTYSPQQPILIDRSLGSPKYLAPELKMGRVVSNPQAADVYSLGITFHNLLSSSPMGFGIHPSLKRMSKKDEYVKELIQLIKAMVNGRPEKRPSMLEVCKSLEKIFADTNLPPRAVAIPPAQGRTTGSTATLSQIQGLKQDFSAQNSRIFSAMGPKRGREDMRTSLGL